MKYFPILLLLITGCDFLSDDITRGQGPFGVPVAGEGYDGHDLKLPHQDEAVALIWEWTYGDRAVWQSAPPVVWKQGDTCTDDDGVVGVGFWCPAYKHCCLGWYNVFSAVAYIEYARQPLSDTALAHELCHAWRFIEGEADADDDHDSICYLGVSSGNAIDGSLVFEANRRLKLVGM